MEIKKNSYIDDIIKFQLFQYSIISYHIIHQELSKILCLISNCGAYARIQSFFIIACIFLLDFDSTKTQITS